MHVKWEPSVLRQGFFLNLQAHLELLAGIACYLSIHHARY